jgi:hypothetical protein
MWKVAAYTYIYGVRTNRVVVVIKTEKCNTTLRERNTSRPSAVYPRDNNNNNNSIIFSVTGNYTRTGDCPLYDVYAVYVVLGVVAVLLSAVGDSYFLTSRKITERSLAPFSDGGKKTVTRSTKRKRIDCIKGHRRYHRDPPLTTSCRAPVVTVSTRTTQAQINYFRIHVHNGTGRLCDGRYT